MTILSFSTCSFLFFFLLKCFFFFLDVPLPTDEPTKEISPIIASVSCDAAVTNVSSEHGVINESNAELVPPTLEIVPQITVNRVVMKGPRGRKLSMQNSKANKEVTKETIGK